MKIAGDVEGFNAWVDRHDAHHDVLEREVSDHHKVAAVYMDKVDGLKKAVDATGIDVDGIEDWRNRVIGGLAVIGIISGSSLLLEIVRAFGGHFP